MSGGKRKSQTADGRGGRFFMLPHCVLASEAFRTASPRAIKVLLALCSKHDGFNNGKIGLGARKLAELVDSQNHRANGKALRECIERGLVDLARSFPRGHRLANEYRLTFIPTDNASATNDYLAWQPGDAGTRRKLALPEGKKRVAILTTREAERVANITTGEETSRCDNNNALHAKPPFSDVSPVGNNATHIGNHREPSAGLPASSRRSPPVGGRPLSAAPDPDELRERVLSALDKAERGSQGQLAALASIRPAALSKFLHNSGSLNEQARIRLTCALPKVAARNVERVA